MYRMHAVFAWMAARGVTVTQMHAHATALMAHFLNRLAPLGLKGLTQRDLITPFDNDAAHGNFLCFRAPHAAAIERALAAADIHADHRGDRMRFGFGLATTIDDVDAAITRMTQILPTL
jgi:kynureninase